MKCAYCGTQTEFLTTMEEPICLHCAEENGFSLCTELGKYIADASFTCDFMCVDCDCADRFR